jgi:uncharacterized protein YndB with AHSA1/START domain
VLDFKPGKSLSYSWRPDDFHKEWEDSVVSYQFAPAKEEGTNVKLNHHKLPNNAQAKNHEHGWNDQVFGPINDFLLQAVK